MRRLALVSSSSFKAALALWLVLGIVGFPALASYVMPGLAVRTGERTFQMTQAGSWVWVLWLLGVPLLAFVFRKVMRARLRLGVIEPEKPTHSEAAMAELARVGRLFWRSGLGTIVLTVGWWISCTLLLSIYATYVQAYDPDRASTSLESPWLWGAFAIVFLPPVLWIIRWIRNRPATLAELNEIMPARRPAIPFERFGYVVVATGLFIMGLALLVFTGLKIRAIVNVATTENLPRIAQLGYSALLLVLIFSLVGFLWLAAWSAWGNVRHGIPDGARRRGRVPLT